MKSLTKGLSALVLLLVALIGMAVPAMAWTTAPTVRVIEINDRLVLPGETIDVERGETLDIKVDLLADEDIDAVEVSAKLKGYEYNDETTTATTGLFDLAADAVKQRHLSLTIPADFEGSTAELALVIEDEDVSIETYTYEVYVSSKRHDLSLDRVLPFDTSSNVVVKAGNFLTMKARIENLGEHEEEDVVFSAAIEGMEGMANDADFIVLDDAIAAGDKETTEDLYIGVPMCAKPGDYNVVTKLLYNNDKTTVTKSFPIKVVASESNVCVVNAPVASKVVVPEVAQAVKAGQTLVLPVTITNAASEAKNYVVSVVVGDMGAVRYNPANAMTVAAGATETMYVYVDVASDAAGEKVLGLNVKAGNELVKEVTIKANVEGEEGFNMGALGLKRVLEIGLVVLIVLIVLVGLIIGFNKLKDDDEDEEDEKSYY
ncbi:MAG: hypothetical protein WC471_04535 [Candidatus Woesearchaeota archaeon]